MKSWNLWRKNSESLENLASKVRPIIQGWINYYGHFNKINLKLELRLMNMQRVKWVKRKYRKPGKYFLRAIRWLGKVA
ncbi:hypothetical protein OAB57_02760, partial [Bacteriovoracaceae bacterium]|nr:hypothetical protein [Bacteriovoracaceae bacterium]